MCTDRLDCSLDEVLLVREVEVRVVTVHLLADCLHRNLLQVCAFQDLLHVLLDFIILDKGMSLVNTRRIPVPQCYDIKKILGKTFKVLRRVAYMGYYSQ